MGWGGGVFVVKKSDPPQNLEKNLAPPPIKYAYFHIKHHIKHFKKISREENEPPSGCGKK